MVDNSQQQIIRSLDKLDTAVQRIIERIDLLPEKYISRDEYEKRRSEAYNELKEDIASLKRDVASLRQEFDQYKQEVSTKSTTSLAHKITIGLSIIWWVIAIALQYIHH
jgi:FtsZ-binding cell division protein ZapB